MLHQDCVPAGLPRAAPHPQRNPALAPDFEPQYHRLTGDASIPFPVVYRSPSLLIAHDAPGALGADVVSERSPHFPAVGSSRTGRDASCPFDEALADIGRSAAQRRRCAATLAALRAAPWKLCRPKLLV